MLDDLTRVDNFIKAQAAYPGQVSYSWRRIKDKYEAAKERFTPNATTVLDIVKDWLKSHGYDGLYTDECGCRVDDLAPCGGEGIAECCAGVYKQCGAEHDYWIGPKEPISIDAEEHKGSLQ